MSLSKFGKVLIFCVRPAATISIHPPWSHSLILLYLCERSTSFTKDANEFGIGTWLVQSRRASNGVAQVGCRFVHWTSDKQPQGTGERPIRTKHNCHVCHKYQDPCLYLSRSHAVKISGSFRIRSRLPRALARPGTWMAPCQTGRSFSNLAEKRQPRILHLCSTQV